MIYIRFYGQLKVYNEGGDFSFLEWKKGLRVIDIINIKKIPLKEIGIIINKGDSVYPDFELKDNDYVSFFPQFENINISGIKLLNLSGLIDTHSHLDEIENIKEVLKTAHAYGLEKIIAVSSDYESSKKILGILNKKFQVKIFPSLGIHPNNLKGDIEKGIDIIKENINEIVAIGECGLDYKYKIFSKEYQKDVFLRQIILASEFKKPMIIHSRGAWEDCFELLKDSDVEKVNFHWFSGDIDILKKILDKGYFISATPALKYSPPHREAIKFAPLETILLETDSPTMHFKSTSEPKDIIITIKYISEIKNQPYDKVIEITNRNASLFFNI